MPTSSPWRITLLGHSSVLVEIPGATGRFGSCCTRVSSGDRLTIGSIEVVATAAAHAPIYDDVLLVENMTYASVTAWSPELGPDESADV